MGLHSFFFFNLLISAQEISDITVLKNFPSLFLSYFFKVRKSWVKNTLCLGASSNGVTDSLNVGHGDGLSSLLLSLAEVKWDKSYQVSICEIGEFLQGLFQWNILDLHFALYMLYVIGQIPLHCTVGIYIVHDYLSFACLVCTSLQFCNFAILEATICIPNFGLSTHTNTQKEEKEREKIIQMLNSIINDCKLLVFKM